MTSFAACLVALAAATGCRSLEPPRRTAAALAPGDATPHAALAVVERMRGAWPGRPSPR